MKKETIPAMGHVNPYNKREVMNDKKAMKSTEKSVKPVAKDTNRTRRKIVKPGVIRKK